MAIIETLRNRPQIIQIIGALFFILCVLFLLKNFSSSGGPTSSKAFYSTDSGESTFVDDIDLLAPFSHYGKEADRVWMYSTDGGKTQFPGYLERYTPAGKIKMQAAMQDYKSGKTKIPPSVDPADTEIMMPGPGHPWVSRSNRIEATKIIKAKIPTDLSAQFQVALPS